MWWLTCLNNLFFKFHPKKNNRKLEKFNNFKQTLLMIDGDDEWIYVIFFFKMETRFFFLLHNLNTQLIIWFKEYFLKETQPYTALFFFFEDFPIQNSKRNWLENLKKSYFYTLTKIIPSLLFIFFFSLFSFHYFCGSKAKKSKTTQHNKPPLLFTIQKK